MTTESMKPYPAYKDSGIEWIGEIPEGWDMRKVSRSFALIGSGTTPKSTDNQYYQNGDINWIITGDLNDGLLDISSKKITSKALEDYSTLKIYPKDTLIVAMYGATIGKICLTNFEACTNQACCALSRSPYILNKFTFYWFIANKHNIINMSYGGGQPNISQDIIRSLKISTPTLAEQHVIVNFLNNQTAKIDTLIKNKQKQIELLKEERTAIINQAVTKGLNPDVPMRDSGIEWLGEIPEHWELRRLKYLSSINPTKSNSNFGRNSDELVTFLPMEKVSEDGDIDTKIKKPIKDLWDGLTYFEENDVIVSKITPCFENGKGAFLKNLGSKIGFGSTEFHVLRAKINVIHPHYLYYVTRTNMFKKLGEAAMTGAAGQKRVTNSFIQNFFISFPAKLEEQDEIVCQIKLKQSSMDELIYKIQNQITLLQEYRTALISEAVTGKIDLRNQHETHTPK